MPLLINAPIALLNTYWIDILNSKSAECNSGKEVFNITSTPSEKFANLKSSVKAMGKSQDRTDLLALFELADDLYLTVEGFGEVVKRIKQGVQRQDAQLKEMKKWRTKWLPLLDRLGSSDRDIKSISIIR